MDYPEFKSDLYEIYKSEVMGETLFSVAAALSLNASRKRKWSSLAKLEKQTKERYLDHVGAAENYPYSSNVVGYIFGILFAALPWKMSLKLLGEGTQPFLEVFTRLLEHSPDCDKAFYRYVVAHEKAIAEFAVLELQGDINSLAPINALIETSDA